MKVGEETRIVLLFLNVSIFCTSANTDATLEVYRLINTDGFDSELNRFEYAEYGKLFEDFTEYFRSDVLAIR